MLSLLTLPQTRQLVQCQQEARVGIRFHCPSLLHWLIVGLCLHVDLRLMHCLSLLVHCPVQVGLCVLVEVRLLHWLMHCPVQVGL